MVFRPVSSRLARSVASRTAHAALRRRVLLRAYSGCGAAVHIPVVSYHDGERKTSEIQCHKPVAPLASSTDRAAEPLRPDVLSQITPSLRKFTLSGKVAVVTGGGRGLGFNMAQALAEVGVKGIAIVDVNQELGDHAAAELSHQTGVDVRFYKVDVRDETAVSNAVEDIVDHYNSIDVLISSAGIADSNMPAETYDVEKFRRLLDINITGTFLIAQACGQKMIELNTTGSMVFIASMSGTIVNYPQEQCCYNASKAAVMQLTKSLGAEWARYGIRVNAISPGYMDTALNRQEGLEQQKKIWREHTPSKRLGSADELNGLAIYLASDASSFMTGANCIIDGGYTLW